MFALIETNNATHIAINIPLDGADKTLPALAAMLENNAIFIRKDYSSCQSVTPKMSFILGDKVPFDTYETELVIQKSSCAIGEDFVAESPDVIVSNAKGLKSKSEQITKQNTEIAFLKSELETLKAKIAELSQDTAPV